jgi:catecholate siderophore receptor
MHKVERPAFYCHPERRPAAGLLATLLAGSALGIVLTLPAAAAETTQPSEVQVAGAAPAPAPETVIIQGQRPEDYRVGIPLLPRLTEPLIDTPQTITVIPEQVLRDRAISNINDALRTVTGISIGAGEFSWQGNNPTIRGFVARNDIFLDGIRDFGSYARDPFNIQSVEVLKGPASILFGRGSTGGVINQPTKAPMLEDFIDVSVVGGTDYTRRGTIDVNRVIPELGENTAFRFNLMGHAQSVSGRNVGKQARFGIAPSLAMGIGTPTRLTISYFNQTANDVPDYGLPWFGTVVAPVERQNFYGFTSDWLHTQANVGTVRFEHDINPGWTIRSTTRYAHYTRDFRISEPIISQPTTTPLDQVNVGFNMWTGPALETMAWQQLDTVLHFNTGGIEHTLVAGMEGGYERSKQNFDNVAGVGTTPLLTPDPDRFFSGTTFPRAHADTAAWSAAVYAIDTLHIGERWEVNLGFRADYFATDYTAVRYSTTNFGEITGRDAIDRIDRAPSYRGALVYKPRPNGSVYFAYGTSFNPSAEGLSQLTTGRGLGIQNSDLAPEENETFEAGTKWDLNAGRLSLTASIFRLTKENARVPDANNPGFNILGGTQQVDGYELGLVGNLTDDWRAIIGYTFLDGTVTKSAPGAAPVGSPLINTPKHTFSFFTDYRIVDEFEVGIGGNYSSSRYASNTAPIKKVPGYWTFDVMVKYDVSERMYLQLNVNNIFDKYYYDQLHPFHVVPGAARTALLSLNFSF